MKPASAFKLQSYTNFLKKASPKRPFFHQIATPLIFIGLYILLTKKM